LFAAAADCACCLQAGAKHVYAVDASPGAADLARKVVAANGLSNRITVITGRAELVQLPVRQNTVDVIISDWMGSMLLHDGLLPALIRARDK
jgi:methylase of polypeptide subunit release factors